VQGLRSPAQALRVFIARGNGEWGFLPWKRAFSGLARLLHTDGQVIIMNATLYAELPVNMTTLSYPGFQSLPKGVRQMLLVSESYFFNEPPPERQEQKLAVRVKRVCRSGKDFMGIPMLPSGFTRKWHAAA
jgi:hypothetical protein